MDDTKQNDAGKKVEADKAKETVKKPVKKRGADAPRQIFEARAPILHDGEPYEPGDPIEVTRDAYDQLKSARAIEGNWKED